MSRMVTALAGVALVWAVGASGVAVYAVSEKASPGPQGPQGQTGQQGEQGPPGTGLSEPPTYGNQTLIQNYRRYVLAVWCGPNGAHYVATMTTDDGEQLQVCDAG